MRQFALNLDKNFLSFVRERAAGLNVNKSSEMDILLRFGIAVHAKEALYNKSNNRRGIEICEFIRRSKMELKPKETGFFSVIRTEYQDTLDMVNRLRYLTTKKNDNMVATSVSLEDDLADFLIRKAGREGWSLSMMLTHFLELDFAVEMLSTSQKMSGKNHKILMEISNTTIYFIEENGVKKIQTKSLTNPEELGYDDFLDRERPMADELQFMANDPNFTAQLPFKKRHR